MSKLDKYIEQKRIYNTVKDKLFHATRRDSQGNFDNRNDKAQLKVKYCGQHAQDWNDAKLFLRASYGYYGSSSGYSAMNKHVATYMVEALNNHIEKIAGEAIELARQDMMKAKEDAREEAEEVLGVLGEDGR